MDNIDFSKIRAVVFDLDGTLYSTRRIKWEVMGSCLGSLKLLYHAQRIRKQFSGQEFSTGENYFEQFFLCLAKRAQVSTDDAKSWYLDHFYGAFVAAVTKRKPFFPVNELLSDLKKSGMRLAVWSDYSCIEMRLHGLGIDPALFDDLVSSEYEGVLKPSVRPLANLAKRFELLPQQCLMVGDRADRDGISAEKFGAHFFNLTDSFPNETVAMQKLSEAFQL